jgi:thiamine transport system substrate-binding protein
MKPKWFSILLIFALLLAGCSSPSAATQTPPTASQAAAPSGTATQPAPTGATQASEPTLYVMTHDSFAASKDVIQSFEQANHAKVQFIASGDAGTALNKAILSKNNPIADVLYGVDNTFLSRALQEGIFEPYNSPLLQDIPDEYKLDPQNRALPVDWGDVCPNYDKAYFQQKNLPPPQDLEDLLKPEYKGLLVVENPATSSPGLAFLLATIGHFGANGYLDYWKGLVKNDVLVVNSWETAYNTDFTRAGGTRPIVISYNSSPAFEVLYATSPVSEAPTGVITQNESCFRQIEFVGILKGTQQRALAEKWVDFMLSRQFQEDMPLQMFVFPVNKNAKLNETFTKYLVTAQKLAQVSPDQIAANRDQWIQAWTQAVLNK